MSFACWVLIIVCARPAIKGQLVIPIYRRASCLESHALSPSRAFAGCRCHGLASHIHAAASPPARCANCVWKAFHLNNDRGSLMTKVAESGRANVLSFCGSEHTPVGGLPCIRSVRSAGELRMTKTLRRIVQLTVFLSAMSCFSAVLAQQNPAPNTYDLVL